MFRIVELHVGGRDGGELNSRGKEMGVCIIYTKMEKFCFVFFVVIVCVSNSHIA